MQRKSPEAGYVSDCTQCGGFLGALKSEYPLALNYSSWLFPCGFLEILLKQPLGTFPARDRMAPTIGHRVAKPVWSRWLAAKVYRRGGVPCGNDLNAHSWPAWDLRLLIIRSLRDDRP